MLADLRGQLRANLLAPHCTAAASTKLHRRRAAALELSRANKSLMPLNRSAGRFIAAARDLLLSSAAQEAVTVGVPRRLKASDAAPRASRSLVGSGSGASSRSGSRAGTPTGAAAAAAASRGSANGLEDEDPLLASGEYSIR